MGRAPTAVEGAGDGCRCWAWLFISGASVSTHKASSAFVTHTHCRYLCRSDLLHALVRLGIRKYHIRGGALSKVGAVEQLLKGHVMRFVRRRRDRWRAVWPTSVNGRRRLCAGGAAVYGGLLR